MAEFEGAVENDFDLLPYSSMPFQQTQPSHLAAVTQLFGRVTAPVETARVLELGCASGGNILPLAARFPEATFLGVDLSQRHVEEGTQFAQSAGLSNIRFEKGDLGDHDFGGATFDYIICHGVYSWVPDHVQDAILRICASTLSDKGVAYVSYNVLPGWHLRKIVRDICLYHAGTEGAPQLRVARARWMLEKVAALSHETSNFGRVLRDEAKTLARQGDSYMLGEFLVPDNRPCYFHEFMDRASGHGLDYVCEAGVAESVPDNLGPERNKLIREIAGTSGAAIEQYMDFFTGRTFRRSLLVKAGAQTPRVLTARNIERLYLSCALTLDRKESTDERFVFRQGEAHIATIDPVLKAGFVELASLYPGNCSFDALVNAVVARIHAKPEDARAKLAEAMLKGAASNYIGLSTTPLRVGRASSPRPKLWRFALAQLQSGQSWAANLTHVPVAAHPALTALAPLMDGAHDHAALAQVLAEAIRSGAMKLPNVETQPTPEQAPQLLQHLLMWLDRFALLEPDPA